MCRRRTPKTLPYCVAGSLHSVFSDEGRRECVALSLVVCLSSGRWVATVRDRGMGIAIILPPPPFDCWSWDMYPLPLFPVLGPGHLPSPSAVTQIWFLLDWCSTRGS